MSLSDKFYEGLSAPLPVAGAQMPTDLVPYAGGPLDALEQHKQKYKQIDYMNRLSERTSKKLRKQLADAETDYETDYEGDDMDKISFVGSDPLSRRAYYLQKLAENPSDPVTPPPDAAPAPPATSASPAPPAPSSPVAIPDNLTREAVKYKAPPPESASSSPQPTVRQRYINPAEDNLIFPDKPETPSYFVGRDGGFMGFGGDETQDLGDSGDFIRRVNEFSRGYDPQRKQRPDNTGFLDRIGRGLSHYGTRAARALSTGAQMGASYLYDTASRNKYLDEGSFIGDYLGQAGRQDLNREMARINAGLAHSYNYSDGGQNNSANARLYADRLRGIDTDLTQKGMQRRDDLLNRSNFRQQLIEDQMSGYTSNGRRYTQDQLDNLRRSAGNTIDSFYGFEGNNAGTPSIGYDLEGRGFRDALRQTGDTAVNPSKQQESSRTLKDMMSKDPSVYRAIEDAFGAEAAQAGVPLAEFAASRLRRDLDYKAQVLDAGKLPGSEDDTLETEDQIKDRYLATRKFTEQILGSMSPEDQQNFIKQVNPGVVQRASEISSLFERDPEAALNEVNNMDPREARYLLDQISLVSRYANISAPQQDFDYSRYERREDRDDWLPSFGGSDLVNPARQQIGAGGSMDQMTGDARDSVYWYNSQRDENSGDQYYLVDDGTLYNTYYNPVTGDINRELITDFAGKFIPGIRSPNVALPQQYRQQFEQQFGYKPWENK